MADALADTPMELPEDEHHRSRWIGQFIDRHLNQPSVHSAQILLVSNRPQDLANVHTVLNSPNDEPGRFSVLSAQSLHAAYDALATHSIDLVIFDHQLPDAKGIWAVASFRLHAPQLPMVVLLDAEQSQLHQPCLQLGVQDVLIREYFDADRFVFVMLSAIERHRASVRFFEVEQVDRLTTLPGRAALEAALPRMMREAKRRGLELELLLIDIDNFKFVNETLGREVGDSFLRMVGARLQCTAKGNELVARFGGDSFAVLSLRVGGEDYVEPAVRYRDAMSLPLKLGSHEVVITVSMGIARYPDCKTEESLIRKARDSVLLAKKEGKNRSIGIWGQQHQGLQAREALLQDLRRAVEEECICLYYQPKVDIRTGEITGVEALARWEHPLEGMIGPERFVPLLEESGLIIQVGQWLLQRACDEVAAVSSDLNVAVNVSAVQFGTDFVSQVEQALQLSGLDASRLCIELTESLLFSTGGGTIEQLQALKRLGVQLAVDDFGTGFSSLSYLNRYPIDEIKIDRSFVQNLVGDPRSATIAGSIIGLGHSLGMKVIAEGVETAHQLDFLRLRACDKYQGFLCAEPMPIRSLNGWLKSQISQRIQVG